MKQIAPASRKMLLLAVGAGMVLIVAGAVFALKPPSTQPDALPQSADAVQSLPLPSAKTLIDAYGGATRNAQQQALAARVGKHIVDASDAGKTGTNFRFIVLGDENRINAFATPDGNIYITSLLLNRLKTEGELAALLAHEIAHLTAHHRPSYQNTGVIAFTPDQETTADAEGVRLMGQAGYDPTAYINVLMMLRDVNMTNRVDFFVSHPSPVNRVAHIDYAIRQQFPDGVPDSLSD